MAKHNFSCMENLSIDDITVCFDTLGCAKNQVDSREMAQSLIAGGIRVVDEVARSNCLILNTCSFIQAATQESIDTFFEYKNFFPTMKIIVTGCMPSRYGKELSAALDEADSFVPCIDESNIFEKVIEVFGIKECLDNEYYLDKNHNSYVEKSFSPYDNNPYAYIKISDGCNRNCSYCMIPKIRGKYKSEKFKSICSEIDKICEYNHCVSNSPKVQEVVLVAQDCGMWGHDFGDGRGLGWLLDNLANKYPNLYFRVLYIQPDAINDTLLDAFKKHNNILKYFDIPVQHCSANILKAMNRLGDRDYLLQKINSIKKKFPKACIRSTLISGFPGESENNFEELCEFLKMADLDYCGVFEYSDEEGSRAYKLNNKIESAVSSRRANELRDIIDSISFAKLDAKIGSKQYVLIEGNDSGRYFGRAFFQAPDVDGYVFLIEGSDVNIGDIVEVLILDTECYDLVGKIADN